MSPEARPAVIVFVYFKASSSDDERIARQLATMQDMIGQRLGAGSLARFGRRRQEAPGQRTWLESYELPRDADTAGLLALRADSAVSAGLGDMAEDAVRIEVFDMQGDLPCA